MSTIEPEIEIVDRTHQSLIYLEHGWPTELCRWHSHVEYELHLIVETRGRVFVGDYIGEFKPGDLFLTGPNVPHNWVTGDAQIAPVPLRDVLVQFSEDNLRGLRAAFPEFAELSDMLELAKSGVAFVGFDPSVARAHFSAIRDAAGAARILAFLRFMVALSAHPDKQTLSVLKLAHPRKNGRHVRIGEIVDYITKNYMEEISLEDVARRAGMSPSTFSRNFQAVTGNRFVEFVNRVRIGHACSMLYETDEQISSICHEVGFQNLANFNRHFLKMKHMTPSAYRETARRTLSPRASMMQGEPL